MLDVQEANMMLFLNNKVIFGRFWSLFTFANSEIIATQSIGTPTPSIHRVVHGMKMLLHKVVNVLLASCVKALTHRLTRVLLSAACACCWCQYHMNEAFTASYTQSMCYQIIVNILFSTFNIKMAQNSGGDKFQKMHV